jgi:two-component system nitrogen regulation response regulator NtrX
VANILIVDDEADIRNLLADILEDEGHKIFQAGNAGGAISTFSHNVIDLVILDIWLEGSEFDGLGVLKKIRSLNSMTPVIMISGHGNIETAVQTIKAGAYDFIEKPFKSEKLIILIDRALSAAQLSAENKELKKNLQQFEFIGESRSIQAIKDEIKNIASTKSRVLITGEPGVGKEALARYIHQCSNRKDKNFIKLDSSSLNHKNFDSEMFGSQNAMGLLEKANGGVLYIDEIGQLDAQSQAKLLKVLQDNAFMKAGNPVTLDIRLISSSSYDLPTLIQNNEFNQSLFYRINVVPITIPPLKDRKSDISPLSNMFISFFSNNLNLPLIELSEEALTHLTLHQWPGNVRQLKNLIEWLMIMHAKSKTTINLEDLPRDLFSGNDNDNFSEESGVIISSEIISRPLRIARDIFERDYLKAQLKRFSGNISETAKFVGMERTALHRKIKALGVVENE